MAHGVNGNGIGADGGRNWGAGGPGGAVAASGPDYARFVSVQLALRGHRVLVVEDDADIAALWGHVLTASGCDVQRLESALGAVDLLRRWRPDVLLLDLGLPYRSGATLLADVVADAQTATIPVVVVSANPESLPLDRRLKAAAVLSKPVLLRVLLATLGEAIAGGPGGRGAPAGA